MSRGEGRSGAGAVSAVGVADNGGVFQDWGEVGLQGLDMNMASVGEMLASRYGLAVLVLRTLDTGHFTGQLFIRGNAGDS